jgi:signal transduction histidine kinase
VITGARFLLDLPLPLLPLFIGNALLLICNGVCFFVNRGLDVRLDPERELTRANYLANFQVSCDLFLLSYLIYFSGGRGNPFIFYFVFHMIISSILLSNRAAYLQATFAASLVGFIVAAPALGLVPPASDVLATIPLSPLWQYAVFVSTLYISVYMTTSIVNRLRERERELEVMNVSLAEQDRLKSKYVMMVSHDIQGSLASIQSYLSVLLNGYTGDVPPASKGVLVRAEKRTRDLLDFVRDLLNLSKMKSESEMETETVNLTETAEKSVGSLQSAYDEKGIVLKREISSEEVLLCGNPVALEQLFTNLLSNALRYTNPGGRVSLNIDATTLEDFILADVTDTGIGIPEDSLPRIFDDFYRAENAKKFEGSGTGLGLSIVGTVIKMHGGRICVDSVVGRGTSIRFTLPKP